jgi:hypothetical protein
MRVSGWRVQPVVFADDGENLAEVEVQAVMIPAAQWQAFKGGGDVAALEQVRAQIEGPAEPPPSGEAAGKPEGDSTP